MLDEWKLQAFQSGPNSPYPFFTMEVWIQLSAVGYNEDNFFIQVSTFNKLLYE